MSFERLASDKARRTVEGIAFSDTEIKKRLMLRVIDGKTVIRPGVMGVELAVSTCTN
jgi:hypothetical protein